MYGGYALHKNRGLVLNWGFPPFVYCSFTVFIPKIFSCILINYDYNFVLTMRLLMVHNETFKGINRKMFFKMLLKLCFAVTSQTGRNKQILFVFFIIFIWETLVYRNDMVLYIHDLPEMVVHCWIQNGIHQILWDSPLIMVIKNFNTLLKALSSKRLKILFLGQADNVWRVLLAFNRSLFSQFVYLIR